MEDANIVLVLRKVPGQDFSSLSSDFTVIEPQMHDGSFTTAELDEYLPKTVAIVAVTEVDAEMIAKALALKVIVANGAGYDNIDVTAATALRIPVVNIPDAVCHATAELALGLMLTVSRQISLLDRELHGRIDDVSDMFKIGQNPGHTLGGKTLGIVGLGHIGKALAEMCWNLRMNIVYHNRTRLPVSQEKGMRYMSFDDLLSASDVISIHTPLTESTSLLFNDDAFLKMKEGAILINTARGGVVDYDALIHFLEIGKLRGVGLDVFPNEPQIPVCLLQQPRAVLTPHIGTNTVETRHEMAAAIARQIRAVCLEPDALIQNLINPDIYRERKTSPVPSASPDALVP